MSEISKSKVSGLKAQKMIILLTLKHVSAISEHPVWSQFLIISSPLHSPCTHDFQCSVFQEVWSAQSTQQEMVISFWCTFGLCHLECNSSHIDSYSFIKASPSFLFKHLFLFHTKISTTEKTLITSLDFNYVKPCLDLVQL